MRNVNEMQSDFEWRSRRDIFLDVTIILWLMARCDTVCILSCGYLAITFMTFTRLRNILWKFSRRQRRILRKLLMRRDRAMSRRKRARNYTGPTDVSMARKCSTARDALPFLYSTRNGPCNLILLSARHANGGTFLSDGWTFSLTRLPSKINIMIVLSHRKTRSNSDENGADTARNFGNSEVPRNDKIDSADKLII